MPRKSKKITREEEIRQKGLDAICEYLDMDMDSLKNIDRATLMHIMQKAKLGMAFQKEMGIAERSNESKTIRVLSLVAQDKKELKNYDCGYDHFRNSVNQDKQEHEQTTQPGLPVNKISPNAFFLSHRLPPCRATHGHPHL